MRRFLLVLLAASPAHANHPLITEDTGVLDKGERQIELHGERGRAGDRRSTDVSAALAYGLHDEVELQLELPYLRQVSGGGESEGRGDAVLSAKWRFFKQARLAMAFKPELLLPTGREEQGLGAGRVRWAANLAAAYELGRLELLGHVGYTRNRNRVGERVSLGHASAAMRWSATDRMKVIIDLGRESNPDPAADTPPRAIAFGVTYDISRDAELGIGLKKALNDEARNRAVLAGVKLRW